MLSFSGLIESFECGRKFTIAEMLNVLNELESSELDKKTKDEYREIFTNFKVKVVS